MTSGIDAGQTSTHSHMSVWAIAALVMSLSICCPLAPLVAARALVQIKADPTLRGKRLAVAAILISLMLMALSAIGMSLWNAYARQPMLAGPVRELQAGLNGDAATFRSGFAPAGAAASDDDARIFLGELTNRYGTLDGIEQNETAKGAMIAGGQGRIPYVLHFRSGDVPAEAVFVAFGGSVFKPVFRWEWIRVMDSQRGDIVYPAEATARATSPAGGAKP